MRIPSEHQIHYKRMILEELREIHKAKNTDYGSSATTTFHEYGVISYVTRMRDKVERYKRISSNPAMVDEDIEEVLMDLCNYAIMCYADMKNEPYGYRVDILSSNMASVNIIIAYSSEVMYDVFVTELSGVAKTQNEFINKTMAYQSLHMIIMWCLQLLVNLKEEAK